MDQLNTLTAVEKRGDMWFKRDDYYKPFDDFGVCGGKLRQCISLVRENKEYIEEECDGTLATASSVHSPQAAIVSRVAKAAGYKSFIGIGNTTVEKALKHRAIQVADSLGSEIVILSDTQAFNSVLYYQLSKLKEERSFFEIQFGFQAKTHRVSILDTIANQVENIPEEVTVLVVPVGSGITFCGILSGVIKYGLFERENFRLIGIQPFGYDRTKLIAETVDDYSPLYGHSYEFYEGDYPYNKEFEFNVKAFKFHEMDIELDNIYESKAYHMMFRDYIVSEDEKVCYWIIGNSNWLR